MTTFINWYLDSGVPGAILGVQGYYSPRPDRVEPILSEQSTTKRASPTGTTGMKAPCRKSVPR